MLHDRRSPPPDRLPISSLRDAIDQRNEDNRRRNVTIFRLLIVGIIALPLALMVAAAVIEAHR